MVHLKVKIQFHMILVTNKIIIAEQGEKVRRYVREK